MPIFKRSVRPTEIIIVTIKGTSYSLNDTSAYWREVYGRDGVMTLQQLVHQDGRGEILRTYTLYKRNGYNDTPGAIPMVLRERGEHPLTYIFQTSDYCNAMGTRIAIRGVQLNRLIPVIPARPVLA